MAFNLFKKKAKNPEPRVRAEQSDAVQRPGFVAPATLSVLKRFYISEKSSRGQEHNHYTFAIDPHATKTDVKHAVQRAYKVTVTGVQIVRLPDKKRTVGRYQGTKAGVKKAIVVLKEGQTIAQAQP